MKINEMFSFGTQVSGRMFGIECEIESIQKFNGADERWIVIEDGSLRNDGREFLAGPVTKEVAIDSFKYLHSRLVLRDNPFSHRTSIHVHVNCQDLDDSVVKNIVLWYTLYEPFFFLMAHPTRRNNIHCVGLDQTMVHSYLHRDLFTCIQSWSKYTALNLIPLHKYGTIEFRHMEGHNNVERFQQWLNCIDNLFSLGEQTYVDNKFLDSQGKIYDAFVYIFKDCPQIMKMGSMADSFLSNSIIDLKLCLSK